MLAAGNGLHAEEPFDSLNASREIRRGINEVVNLREHCFLLITLAAANFHQNARR